MLLPLVSRSEGDGDSLLLLLLHLAAAAATSLAAATAAADAVARPVRFPAGLRNLVRAEMYHVGECRMSGMREVGEPA